MMSIFSLMQIFLKIHIRNMKEAKESWEEKGNKGR
jgi:hypothetical protein